MLKPRKPVRRQRIELGGTHAIKQGAPWGSGDIFYQLMEMSWAVFIAVAAAFFLTVNLGFGALYASLPGSISNAAPGSLADGFYFSVETLATVGYGEMAPATHLGHAIAVVEIMAGMFMIATMTGLIFARFARPRESIIFSNVVTVARIGERRLAMIRLVGRRARPLADVTAQMNVLETVTLPSGRQYRRNVALPLVNDHIPVMVLTWSLAHVIDETSPLAAIIDDPDAPLRLTVTVRGLDTLLSSATFGGHAYNRADIRHDAEFVDVFDNRDDGSIHVDITRLHDTEPVRGEAAAAGG